MSKNLLAEPELISLILSRDKKGAEALFDQFAPVLQLAIIRYFRNRKSVEIILENTFIRIWLNIDLFLEQEKPLLSWMLSVARLEVAQFQMNKENKIENADGTTKNLENGLQSGF